MKTPVAQAEEQGTKGSEENPFSQIDVLHVIEEYIYIYFTRFTVLSIRHKDCSF